MTATIPAATSTAAPDTAESDLLVRVLGALLREDVVGLRTRSTLVDRQDGPWLRLTPPGRGDDALLLPVVEDGFQSVYAARLPLLVRESDGAELTGCGPVLDALRALADPADRGGFDALADECRQSLATTRLHTRTRDDVVGGLTARYGPDPADWTGLRGGLAHDTLAARHEHPVYPTARGRSGLDDGQLRAYAPEFHPRFALRWLAVPRHALTVRGTLPRHWPTPATLGLPELSAGHLALPVHPLTPGARLREALRATGLEGDAVLAELPYLDAVPTLSMRTVALAAHPTVHLKLPLATATLGWLNRRTIKPGTLVDGMAGQRLLESVIAREPRFRDTVLHADETVYAHAGHELLAVLCRRYPAGLDDAVVVPMAGLLSEGPGGRLVIDHLADRFYGGEPVALLDACLTLLFDWQTTLFGYGIALESHQQNISLVLDGRPGRTRLRLLLKDNDGPRVNTRRLREALGADALAAAGFDDARILVDDDRAVTDLFTTITVHLCAGAYAFGLARHGRAPLETLLGLVRDRLAEAVERLGTAPGQPGAVLRAHVLRAPELPVKAMVTAGTLLTKERSGAADINKHYTTGPNYLRRVNPLGTAPTGLPTADHVVAHTLLNCFLREVSGPEHQIAVDDGHLLFRLPRRDVLLRIAVRRTSLLGAHRFRGPVLEQRDGGWADVDWRRLAAYVQEELSLRTGVRNEEFSDQLVSSHRAVSAALAARSGQAAAGGDGLATYLASEQSLLFGHRFHPTPKARSGDAASWLSYAPEAGASFPLRHLAVREHLIAEEAAGDGATAPLDGLCPHVPAGYRLLPAHPWQYEMLRDRPPFREALDRGDILDLGPGGRPFAATASVRTLYDGETFLKFSLNVRITNCLRKNASYELSGAVALTRVLEPVLTDLADRFPGSAVLREPAYRSLALPGPDGTPDRALLEGFGVIVREGLSARLMPGTTPLLAAAVADEYPTGPGHLSRLLDGAGPRAALDWWAAYLQLLVPPVLAAYFDHGLVLEPHLQNVLVCVDDDGMPAQVLFRDLEGTKLVPEHHADTLAGLPADVARPLTYDARRGWDRVVYCLLVNHVAEMLGAVADLHPRTEPALWAEVRATLQTYADRHGCPPRLAALLAGVPLPAKANLLTRWERRADREAGYLYLPSPLAEDVVSTADPVRSDAR
ncbi:IucA/IucC family protein [Streptomyces sp. NPDC015127]|uniref:IucA/IucC family protein n=1 Tax=Streptomyces sp. NPDC015127 TaxID=3364939 RepID=UPI003701AEDA